MRMVHVKSRAIVFGLLIFVIAISNYARIRTTLKRFKNLIVPINHAKLTLFYNRKPRAHPVWKYRRIANEKDLQTKLEKRLELASDKKFIIYWAPGPFVLKSPYNRPDRAQCGNCEITYDRTLISDGRTGAILYHFDAVRSWDMPKWRNPNHLHVFWSMESAGNMKNLGYSFATEDKFGMNATMSFRLDSDFPTTYGDGGRLLESKMGNNDSIYNEIMRRKSKLAIATISNCRITPGARIRLALISELKSAGLDIDTFGSCFSNKISSDQLSDLIPRYKFYFAYENSYHCNYYITEKLFIQAFFHDIVPVVWGATKEHYEAIVPEGSFIYAEDFESPKHLIGYLEHLDQNDKEYLKFFRWRTMKLDAAPQYHRQFGFCALCRALHGMNVDDRFNPRQSRSSLPLFSDGVARRTVPSLRHYLYDDDNQECFDILDNVAYL